MSHDLLLEWASERGEGSWPQFRDAHEWLFEDAAATGWRPTAGWSARTLTTLGHIEIDWQAGVWSASAPVLTLLPSAGAHALLTGGRTRALHDRLQPAVWEEASDVFLVEHAQRNAPTAVLIAGEDESAIEGLANRLGIPYELSVSDRLSRLLPTLDSYLALSHSTPAATGYGVERFDVTALEWRAIESDREPGFYRYDIVGRPAFRLLDNDGSVYDLDIATGVYAALSRWGENLLRYQADPVNGTLVVPFGAPLPTLQARTAALCSGLAPPRHGGSLTYWNVPRIVADRIARSLDQTLIADENDPPRGPA
jgi:hypothetical protein